MASKLPQPIFTPATKAELGAHDENIDFAAVQRLVGRELAAQAATRRCSCTPRRAPMPGRGIIIADTKFESAWTTPARSISSTRC